MNGNKGKVWIEKAREWILELFYPRAARCLCCGDPRKAEWEDCLCPKCRKAIGRMLVPAESCNRCLSPIKKGQRCAFCHSPAMQDIAAVYAPYRYGKEVRQLIHAFKFDACNEALPVLGEAMSDALMRRDFDCITPVPLHPKRLKSRGVNQALLLSEEIGRRQGIPVRELLKRDSYHKPQSRTPLEKRKVNVEKAFSCPGDASGLRVLLVDDVRTSGSTAAACAKALKAAGAKEVFLCTAAVVYRHGKNGR